MRRLLRLPLATLGALALLAATGHAAVPGWGISETISAAGETASTDIPQIVIDETYGATAIWVKASGGQYQLRSAHRDPGGGWGIPVDIGSPADGISLAERAVVSAPNGDVTALWSVYDGANNLLYSSIRNAITGNWSTPALASPAGTDSDLATIRSDPSSRIWAVWTEKDGNGDPRTRLASRAADSATWVPEPFVSPSGSGVSYPTLAVAPNGDIAVSWTDNTGNGSHVYARVLEHTGPSWTATEDFLGTCTDSQPQDIAFTPASTLTIAYASCEGGDPSNWHVKSATRPAGGSWSAATDLSAGVGLGPRLAITPAGDAVATWTGITTGPLFWLAARERLAGDAWGTERTLSTSEVANFGGSPAALPSGSVLWPTARSAGGPTLRPRTQAWTPGGVWEQNGPWETGLTASLPALAVDGAGNSAMVWRSETDSVRATIGDGTGPRLDNLFVATTAIAGIATSFNVEPADDWTQLGTTTWDFGDGQSATGTTVDHTYAAAGTYTVTVSSRDVGLNETTATRTITVVAADTPPGDTPPGSPTPGGDAIPVTETPSGTPAPGLTTPATLAPVKPPAGPRAEARLRGRKLTVAATVKLKRGSKCRGKATGRTKVAGKRYTLKLRLTKVRGACVASGSVTLKKAPPKKAKLRITISGRGLKTRTLTTAL